MPATELDQVVNLCKRRGFVFPSAEIYGGFRSTYDYGPLGVLLLRNVKDAWWRSMVQLRDDVVGLDAAILVAARRSGRPRGHLANFTDPLVDCKAARSGFRHDKLDDPDVCPSCGSKDSFTEARQFNLMFKTHAGPVEDDGAVAYLRPETAQGMFVNFTNVLQTTPQEAAVRHRPDGQVVPQRDHAAATSIFRTREFEQMEMEFFVPPGRGAAVVRVLVRTSGCDWYVDLGIPADAAAAAAPRRRRAVATTRPAPPTWSSSSRGAGASSRASPTAPTTTSPSTPSTRARSSTTSTRPPTSATCPT